jgi:hypothetical protein
VKAVEAGSQDVRNLNRRAAVERKVAITIHSHYQLGCQKATKAVQKPGCQGVLCLQEARVSGAL